MRRLVYLASARRDLLSILDYVTRESGSLAVGRALADQLRAHCAKLATLPGTLGRARPELRSDRRSSADKGYVLFFRYREDTLEVVDILEGHRDVEGYSGGASPDE